MYAKTHTEVPLSGEELLDEVSKIKAGVHRFADEMEQRLTAKLQQGWRGWDDPENAHEIYNAMLAHGAGVPMATGQEIDIANFAMFLWYQRTRRKQGTP
jgi:hypothetical protein